jgi:ketosteroid isomerase-like protein
MTDRETIRKLIEQAYAARAIGDIKGAMAGYHADGVFELAGEKRTLALAGAVKGHANVQEVMTGLAAAFEFLQRDIISMIIEGDRAAVHSRLRIRFVPKDKTITTELVDMFKIKDGKIVELVEFADTALIKELTGGS